MLAKTSDGWRDRPIGASALHAERGQALILWILAATVILVIGAVVVDVGLWLTERRQAQLAADFAALAAATELHEPAGDPVAKGWSSHSETASMMRIRVWMVQVDPNYGPDMVEVTIEQDSPMLFAGIFGAGAFDIGARAVGTDPAEDSGRGDDSRPQLESIEGRVRRLCRRD